MKDVKVLAFDTGGTVLDWVPGEVAWGRGLIRCRRRGRDRRAERGNGVEQLAAMAAKHYAEILEILRRQLRQRVPID